MNSPLLITAYQRPILLRNLLNQISDVDSNIYIFVDGKAENDSRNKTQLIEECRQLAFSFSKENKNSKLLFPKENLGLAKGVVSAIDWAFEFEKSLVILEDDLSLHSEAVRVADHYLTRFKDKNEVGSISLYRPAILDESEEFQGVDLLSKLTTSWGWATWVDRWTHFKRENFMRNSLETSNAFLRIGGLAGLVRWQGVIRAIGQGNLDSWAYPWMFTHFLNKWNSIIPKINLIENLGFGVNATHTKIGSSNKLSLKENYTFDEALVRNIPRDIHRELLRSSYGIFPYSFRVKNLFIGD